MATNGLRGAAALVISTAAMALGGCTAGTTDTTPATTTAATAADTTGATATAGAAGAPGAAGAAGPTGPAGADGSNGADGAPGTAGARGPAGSAGPTGAHGAAGLSTLVDVANLPPNDSHCAGGGIRIDSGLDANGDGTLEESEISTTTYSCEQVKRSRVVFVTSQTFDGNLGGIAGADAKCMAAAAGSQALAGKSFRAWVSTASSSPASSFASDGKFVTTDGSVLGETFNNLREGTLMAKIKTEAGASFSTPVWSGTDENGYNEADADCGGWTSASTSVEATRSSSDIIQWYWSASEMATCDLQAALYCFEQ